MSSVIADIKNLGYKLTAKLNALSAGVIDKEVWVLDGKYMPRLGRIISVKIELESPDIYNTGGRVLASVWWTDQGQRIWGEYCVKNIFGTEAETLALKVELEAEDV